MFFYDLDEFEVSEIRLLLAEVCSQYDSVEDTEFLKEAGFIAHDLPRRLRSELHKYRYLENGRGLILIRGYPVDQDRIGPTPNHWIHGENRSSTLAEEILLVLCGSLLGDPIAWATQQNGYLVHEIVPIKEYETEQLGFSSQQTLTWHIEDAFHEYRGDYLGMMCMRNPGQTATLVGSINDLELEPQDVDYLFQSHYTIRPDESHLKSKKVQGLEQRDIAADELDHSYQSIDAMNTQPQKLAVLYGDRNAPYIRVDPYFMDDPEEDGPRRALNNLIDRMDAALQGLVLQPGEMVFIDNYRVVHGRVPFVANYDGRDRWLKRINIARDLRKSRSARLTATDRRIF